MQSPMLSHPTSEHASTVEGIPAEDHHQGHHNDVHHAHHVSDAQSGQALHGQILQQLQYAHQHPMEVQLQVVQHEHADAEGLHHNPHHHSLPPTHLQENQDGQEHTQHAATGHIHENPDLQTTGIPVPQGGPYTHQLMDPHQQLAHYHHQLAQFHPQAYQQQLAHYHQSQLHEHPGMYIVQGVPHQDMQAVYQDASAEQDPKHADANSIEEEAAAAHLTALRNTGRSDGQPSMEDHAHAMGHHAMGQMQMDGQSLHPQVLTGYPAMGSEVLVTSTAPRSGPSKRKAWRASHEGDSAALGAADNIDIGARARRRQTRRPDRLCHHEGCFVTPTYNYPNEKKRIFCVSHKLDGMVNVVAKRCAHPDCHVNPRFNYEGTTRGLYCSEHKLEGMINVIDRRCQEADCPKFPSHNYPGSHKKLYCATHKKEGMSEESPLQICNVTRYHGDGELLLVEYSLAMW